MKIIDITGCRFNRLTALRRVENSNNVHRWECLCDCGNTHIVRKGNLMHGQVKSCGCLDLERLQSRKTHGHFSDGAKTRVTYLIWYMMIARCTKPTHPLYPDYGGRGIKVCDDWLHDFSAFLRDMGLRPPGLTIDRIKNESDYSKANCRWATYSEQNRNRRPWGSAGRSKRLRQIASVRNI